MAHIDSAARLGHSPQTDDPAALGAQAGGTPQRHTPTHPHTHTPEIPHTHTPTHPHSSARKQRSRLGARIRQIALLLTTFSPGPIRKLLYRTLFGYRIGKDVRLGTAYLDCRTLTIEDGAHIAHGVAFLGCGEVRIGRNVRIGPLNLFAGGERIELGDYSQVLRLNFINAIRDHDCTNEPDSTLSLGYGAVLTAEHRIDFTDRVRIGRCSIIAGRGTSFWTHNVRAGRPVEIGDYCYIGSECRFAPGASVADCSIIGLGSVITRPLAESWSLYAGVPARRKRSLRESDFPMIFGKNRRDLPDEPYPSPPEIEAETIPTPHVAVTTAPLNL